MKNAAKTIRAASPARRRLLDTATRLFYAEGIHAVGIDRIIAEADVAKATFYSHFPSKDDLVVAYLTGSAGRQ
jgi:AcrR family transcriptional regulator